MRPARQKKTPLLARPEPRKPRLRVVASTAEDKRVRRTREEALEPVHEMRSEERTLDERMLMTGIAARMLALESENRAGKLRTEEASLQNTLVRAIHTGKIANLDRFERDFKRILNQLMGMEETDESEEVVEEAGEHERPITKIAAEIFSGVRADLVAVRELERSFARRAATPESRQLLATNDYLDAAHKIDVVEVSYREGSQGLEVEHVILVQVKNSEIPHEEIKKIHAAHERFVLRDMLAADRYHPKPPAPEVKAVLEMLKKKFTLADLQAPLGSLLGEIARAGEELKDEDIRRLVEVSSVPRAILKVWLGDPSAKQVMPVLFLAVGMTEKSAGVMTDRLAAWASVHPPTSAEIAEVAPSPPAPRVVGAARFESVVMHGGKVEKRTIALRPGERKVLTAV